MSKTISWGFSRYPEFAWIRPNLQIQFGILPNLHAQEVFWRPNCIQRAKSMIATPCCISDYLLWRATHEKYLPSPLDYIILISLMIVFDVNLVQVTVNLKIKSEQRNDFLKCQRLCTALHLFMKGAWELKQILQFDRFRFNRKSRACSKSSKIVRKQIILERHSIDDL